MAKTKPQLDIERIEYLVAERLAKIFIKQTDYQKQKERDMTEY